jgi:hypothetical protein
MQVALLFHKIWPIIVAVKGNTIPLRTVMLVAGSKGER